jgi:hypothetical protein
MGRQAFHLNFQVDLPIGWLSADIEKIAERWALRLERWHAAGFGRSRGVAVEAGWAEYLRW